MFAVPVWFKNATNNTQLIVESWSRSTVYKFHCESS